MPARTFQSEIMAVLPTLVGTTCLYHEAGTLMEASVRDVQILPDRFRIELDAKRPVLSVRSSEESEWTCGATWEFAGIVPGMLIGRYNPWTLVYDPAWIARIVEWSTRAPDSAWDQELVALINGLAKERRRERPAG